MWSFAEAGEYICGIWENLPCLPCRLLVLSAKYRYNVTSSEGREERESNCTYSQIFWNIMLVLEAFGSLYSYQNLFIFFSNPNCWNVATAKTTTYVSVQQIVTSLQPFASACRTWSNVLVFYAHVIMWRLIRECHLQLSYLPTHDYVGIEYENATSCPTKDHILF